MMRYHTRGLDHVTLSVQTLTRIAAAFPRCVVDNIAEYIEIAIHHLHVLTPFYLRYYVSNADDQAEPLVNPEADDRSAIGLDQLMNALTDLLTSYTRMRQARDVMLLDTGNGKRDKCTPLMEIMIYDLLIVSQISRENVSVQIVVQTGPTGLNNAYHCLRCIGRRMVRGRQCFHSRGGRRELHLQRSDFCE
jgi:hypothetical protein